MRQFASAPVRVPPKTVSGLQVLPARDGAARDIESVPPTMRLQGEQRYSAAPFTGT